MSLGPPDHFTHLGQRLLGLDAELRGTVLWQSDQQRGGSGTVRAVQAQKTTATMVFQSSDLPGPGSPRPTEQGELLPALALLATSRIKALGSSSPSLLCEFTPSFQVCAYHLQETSLLNSGAMGRLWSQCSLAYSSPLSFKTWHLLQAAQGSPYLTRKPHSLIFEYLWP